MTDEELLMSLCNHRKEMGAKLHFSLTTISTDDIIAEITNRTGLTPDEVESLAEFEVDDARDEVKKAEESRERADGEFDNQRRNRR